jgi:hypothetical protein
VLGQRSKREFGRQAEHEIGQKGTSWDPVGLLHSHLRDFSDSLSGTFVNKDEENPESLSRSGFPGTSSGAPHYHHEATKDDYP